MAAVIRSNYRDVLPEVFKLIENCCCVGIDTEFTGLFSRDTANSLFDNVEQRYRKIKANVAKFQIFQFGLAIFVNERRTDPSQVNFYKVHTYNFYLFPSSIFEVEECFSMQPSSVEFLRENSFQFAKVFEDGISYLNAKQESILRESLEYSTNDIETARGFTQVISYLIKAQKPIIGHNMLLDLAFIYEKFIQPLPSSWEEFKASIHQLFPLVIDTKRLCYSLRKVLTDCNGRDLLSKTHLEGLYNVLAKRKTGLMKLHGPVISHSTDSPYKAERYFHEAAFDAFCSGFVFLRLSHLTVLQGLTSTQIQPVPFSEYILKLRSHFNLVNMIQGPLYCVNLEGSDLIARRPPLIVLEKNCHSVELTKCLTSYSKGLHFTEKCGKLIVAMPNHLAAEELMASFTSNSLLNVRYYSWWLDSKCGCLIKRVIGTALHLMIIAIPS